MKTDCLEQHLDTLTELVSTLVEALGRNAANVAPPSFRGSLLLTLRVGRLNLPKTVGTPHPIRNELIPAHVEGVLGADVKTSPKRHVKTTNSPQNPTRSSALGIQFSTYLNGQWPTQTWMMIMTSCSNTRLAPGEVPTYVLGLMLDTRSTSRKQRTDPLSEQRPRKNA